MDWSDFHAFLVASIILGASVTTVAFVAFDDDPSRQDYQDTANETTDDCWKVVNQSTKSGVIYLDELPAGTPSDGNASVEFVLCDRTGEYP